MVQWSQTSPKVTAKLAYKPGPNETVDETTLVVPFSTNYGVGWGVPSKISGVAVGKSPWSERVQILLMVIVQL